jgi:sarcosine oxidase subunit beta
VERADILIAGGGIVGTALAWALAERGGADVAVVALDLGGLYASSELNAGGARATWWQPVNIATCAATLEFFRRHREEFGFRQHGYLWLYDDAPLFARAREKLSLQNSFGLGVTALAPADVGARFPIVDRALDELVGATFSPRDGLVNPNAVRTWFRRQAQARGVRFLDHHYIETVATRLVSSGGGDDAAGVSQRLVESVGVVAVQTGDVREASDVLREILTRHRIPAPRRAGESHIGCRVLVNCLGAWSPLLSAKLGIADPTEPVRRQIALCDVRGHDRPAEVDVASLGMIVDASNVYFHPEGANFLAGYSIPSEPPGYDFSYDGDTFFERYVWPSLAHRCSMFECCRHVGGWAGLYDVTPDRSGIAGPIEGFANLFEAHSFTGRGVMQSYGIAVAMAELIDRGRFGELDLTPLARARFADPDHWVTEDLPYDGPAGVLEHSTESHGMSDIWRFGRLTR